jgi:hypothetical protein
MPDPRTAKQEVARLQQMLDYVLQHVRAREKSLDDPGAQVIFEHARDSIRDLQDQVLHYMPHARQLAQAQPPTRH